MIINDEVIAVKNNLPKQKILFANMKDIGFIILTREENKRNFSEFHLKLIESVAEQARAAIERARKIRDEKARAMYKQRKQQYNF